MITVASRFLFDITMYAPEQVALDADAVQAILPHSGSMRQLDHVIHVDRASSHSLGVKHVHEDEFWVSGHFPDRAVLPGVLQLEAAAQMCCIHYYTRMGLLQVMGFTRCQNASFRQVIVPGDTLYLLVEEQSINSRRFVCRTQGITDGQLAFEAEITGMAI